jgi:hypothetical protein
MPRFANWRSGTSSTDDRPKVYSALEQEGLLNVVEALMTVAIRKPICP